MSGRLSHNLCLDQELLIFSPSLMMMRSVLSFLAAAATCLIFVGMLETGPLPKASRIACWSVWTTNSMWWISRLSNFLHYTILTSCSFSSVPFITRSFTVFEIFLYFIQLLHVAYPIWCIVGCGAWNLLLLNLKIFYSTTSDTSFCKKSLSYSFLAFLACLCFNPIANSWIDLVSKSSVTVHTLQ